MYMSNLNFGLDDNNLILSSSTLKNLIIFVIKEIQQEFRVPDELIKENGDTESAFEKLVDDSDSEIIEILVKHHILGMILLSFTIDNYLGDFLVTVKVTFSKLQLNSEIDFTFDIHINLDKLTSIHPLILVLNSNSFDTQLSLIMKD